MKNGRLFEFLTGFHYLQYKGVGLSKTPLGEVKYKV